MYRRIKRGACFHVSKRPLTKAGGKVERRARITTYIVIGIGLAGAVILLLYFAVVGLILADLFQVLIKATIIPLVIVTFYLIGLLTADSDIYRDREDEHDHKRE